MWGFLSPLPSASGERSSGSISTKRRVQNCRRALTEREKFWHLNTSIRMGVGEEGREVREAAGL
jgi:hypothetical protein